MQTQPFFTIAVPTYNRAELLQRCLERILRQSFDDYELLVSDNASTDNTRQVVESFDDSRISYHCRQQNDGPWANCRDAAAMARGRFLVIHQDDDQLHTSFLQRCHAACAADPAVTAYATPYWRGDPGDGYRAACMPDLTDRTDDYITHDRVLYIDGAAAAVSYLYAVYVQHPGCALRTETLRQAGGYSCREGLCNDVISQVRVMLNGRLAYDPRPGSVFYHGADSYSQTAGGRAERHRRLHRMYHYLLGDMEAAGVDWRGLLFEHLCNVSQTSLVHALGEWARYDAPVAQRQVGRQVVAERTGRSRLGVARWFIRHLGWHKALRYARSRKVLH
jgi:glycosyltransferase involved in cell wall biosynthesis